MSVRDRIIETVKVPASSLVPHPRNWRTHDDRQRSALRGSMDQLGYAVPILTRRLPDGRLQVLDGHCRAEELGDAVVTVAVTDLNDDEARLALLTIDPLSALAGKDQAVYDDLAAGIEAESQVVQDMIAEGLSKEARLEDELPPPSEPAEKWLVVVECASEDQQARLLERLKSEGLEVRALVS